MAGWTELNGDLRRSILSDTNINSDIICIQETHLSDNTFGQPALEGYKWRGHCRTLRHINSNRTHGGVGIFIKESLYQEYNISVIDEQYEGILAMLFKDKISGFCYIVFCCYLPPETSPYGRDSNSFFTHLLYLIYLHSYTDCTFICGDINARISNKKDTINVIDHIPDRTAIDEGYNKHGEAFLDFLIEARLAVTNGRINGHNDFTSVSTRGKSLVDYIAVPHENLIQCVSCDVHPNLDIIERNELYSLISEHSKPSDHSPVKLTFMIGPSNGECCSEYQNIETEANSENPNINSETKKKKYNFNSISRIFE